MIPTLAIDPGATGGAVYLDADGRTVLGAWHWVRRKRKAGTVYVLRSVVVGHELPVVGYEHLGSVGLAMFDATAGTWPVLLVCEGLFIPRRKRGEQEAKYTGRVRSTLELAESAALVYGPNLTNASELLRPTAAVWRPAVLGLPANASSDLAERMAIQLAGATMTGLGELGSDPHVAEAAAMARWGWVQQRQAQGAM